MALVSTRGDGSSWPAPHESGHRANPWLTYSRPVAGEYPLINLWTSDEGYVLTAELPGVAAEDLDIAVCDNIVTLRGIRKPEPSENGQTYHRRERGLGPFSRSLELPFEVDAKNVEATLRHGVLHLVLPRSEKDKPKKIQIQTA